MENTNHQGLIDSFQGMKIAVIGEAMLDSYLHGSTDRLCREAPVPVVNILFRENVPGGAANTAANIRSLGGDVIFLSVTGSDQEGEMLRMTLMEADVPTYNVIASPRRSTLVKQRILAGSQMVVRYDQGSTLPLDPIDESALIERMEEVMRTCEAVLISDYDYGILTPKIIRELTRMQEEQPMLIVVDSKRLPDYRNLHVTAVKPNYTEAINLLQMEKVSGTNERVIQIAAHGEEILDLTGAQIAAVTIDQEGALVFERDRLPYRTYAHPQPNSQAAGAGDTFIAAFTLALASGATSEAAAELASAASTVVVGKDGTSTCYTDELHSYFSSEQKVLTDAFQAAARMAAYRRENRRIVFTNGCFDILHRGHITYLNRAKALGDVLIVGVNSDESIRRLKGPLRPINSLEDRANVLAALSAIDHIIPFEDDTPQELIRLIQPDVFVKGGDYTRETLPEAPLVESLGGKVWILPYLEQRSTTGIIERIQSAAGTGGAG